MILQLDIFEFADYEFLTEFQRVMKVVASALKTMEANQYTFGLYLPTLFGMRNKLAALKGTVKHCAQLVHEIESAFETRFSKMMDIFNDEGRSIPAYIAMVSNPKYKLNYMNLKRIPPHIELRVKQILLNAALSMDSDSIQTDADDADTENDSMTMIDDDGDDGLLVFNNVLLGTNRWVKKLK